MNALSRRHDFSSQTVVHRRERAVFFFFDFRLFGKSGGGVCSRFSIPTLFSDFERDNGGETPFILSAYQQKLFFLSLPILLSFQKAKESGLWRGG